MMPEFEYNRITSQVLAGRNPLTAEDMRRLCAEGVTHVLDLRQPAEWMPPNVGQEAVAYQFTNGICRRHLPIDDFSAPDSEHFEAAVAFLEEALSDPAAQVYVHCRAGMERTPTILIAYFATRNGTSCQEALIELQKARSRFQPLPHQVAAVEAWLQQR